MLGWPYRLVDSSSHSKDPQKKKKNLAHQQRVLRRCLLLNRPACHREILFDVSQFEWSVWTWYMNQSGAANKRSGRTAVGQAIPIPPFTSWLPFCDGWWVRNGCLPQTFIAAMEKMLFRQFYQNRIQRRRGKTQRGQTSSGSHHGVGDGLKGKSTRLQKGGGVWSEPSTCLWSVNPRAKRIVKSAESRLGCRYNLRVQE